MMESLLTLDSLRNGLTTLPKQDNLLARLTEGGDNILLLLAKITWQDSAAYQADDLDVYDYGCDEISTAKAVLMANLSSYGLDVLSK
ncbi:hypothetical protein Tco_0383942, partial [Tanacetum coccineum]